MVHIRDHYYADMAHIAASDRDELIDIVTDVDDEDDDDDGDEPDDEDDLDDLADELDTETEEIPFTYCHPNITNHQEAVDNELSTPIYPHDQRCCGGPHGQHHTDGGQAPNGGCSVLGCNGSVGGTRKAALDDRAAAGGGGGGIQRYLQLGGRMFVLFAAAFALLITFAVYLEQLNASDERIRALAAAHRERWRPLPTTTTLALYDEWSRSGPTRLNGMGALCFVNGVVFYGLCGAAVVAAWWGRWWLKDGIQLLRFPLPSKRVMYIASVSGTAGAACFVCSYQRVACHLQDPLKGFCLAFAIVFYFMFCKRVMGLQKIFAATTAVVGLLIAVDYGMCDSFRCRGVDVPPQGRAALAQPTTGWQSRAVWTMGYIGALALWTLQWLLLEGDVVTTFQAQRTVTSNRLLATVSRLVSMSTAEEDGSNRRKADSAGNKTARRKPKALLVAAWLHGVGSLATLSTGLIDIVPGTGSPTTINEFIYDSFQTLVCHGNLCHHRHNRPVVESSWHALDTLPMGSPPPSSHGQQQRIRRSTSPTDNTSIGSMLANGTVHEVVVDGTVHLVSTLRRHSTTTTSTPGGQQHHLRSGGEHNRTTSDERDAVQTNASQTAARKINTEKYWKKYKSYAKRRQHRIDNATTAAAVTPMHHNAPAKSATQPKASADDGNNDNSSSSDGGDDEDNAADDAETVSDFTLNWPIMRTSLVFCAAYAVFLVCAVQFLFDTESAVFTVATMSLALPVAGIFWSMFELKTLDEHIVSIVWAPEVTGELICSVLGTPIVVLGLCLFASAHLDDVMQRQRTYTALAS